MHESRLTCSSQAYLEVVLQRMAHAKNTLPLSMRSFDELRASGKTACAFRGAQHVQNFLEQEQALSIPIMDVFSLDDVQEKLNNGICAAAIIGKSQAEVIIAGNNWGH